MGEFLPSDRERVFGHLDRTPQRGVWSDRFLIPLDGILTDVLARAAGRSGSSEVVGSQADTRAFRQWARPTYQFGVDALIWAIAIPLTTVLRYLTRLEKDGYITRKVDPTDRRRVFVSLTALGYRQVCEAFGLDTGSLSAAATTTIGFAAPAQSAAFAHQ